METDRWIEVVTKVREALAAENLDAVLNLTSSGSKFPEEMRLAHLPILKPEMCSYDPGTMNWANSYVFLNTPSFLEKLGELTIKEEIKPELEIFDGGMIGNVEYYLKKGFLKERKYQLHCLQIKTWFNVVHLRHRRKSHGVYAWRNCGRMHRTACRTGRQYLYGKGRSGYQCAAG